MARYEISIKGVFDTEKALACSDKIVMHLVRNCCPGSFGFNVQKECFMTNCFRCWENALKEGVRVDDAENVHVERLG